MRVAFIDPWHPALYRDALFDPASSLNRDDVFRPWIALRDALEARGIPCHTADLLVEGKVEADESWYFSIGQREFYPLLSARSDVWLKAYWQLEPPVVDPQAYLRSWSVNAAFESVYAHSTESWPGSRKLIWPQVKDGWLGFPEEGRKLLCMVNGNKSSQSRNPQHQELYSERRRALEFFGDRCDLYGPGWDGHPRWKGFVPDKFKILAQYDFCLCFENQAMPGYVTEKIFECMFAGCIPIYLGAPDIAEVVWPECFINMRQADGYADLERYMGTWDASAKAFCRAAMRNYFESADFAPFKTASFVERLLKDAGI